MNKPSVLSLVYKTFLRFFLPLGIIAPFSYAQPKAENPNPRQILTRGVEVIGGKNHLQAIFSKQIFGTFTRARDGAAGAIEIFTRQPHSYYWRINFGNQFEQVGFNGLSGYRWVSGEEAKSITDKELEALQAEAFHQNYFWYQNELQRLNKLQKAGVFALTAGLSAFLKLDHVKYLGQGVWQGKNTHTIETYLNQGAYAKFDFDVATGLLVREEISHTETTIYEYGDYRKVNEILEPYFIRITTATKDVYEIKVQRILHKQAIENEKFEMPRSAQNSLPNLQELVATTASNQEKILSHYDRLSYSLYWKQTGTGNDSETGQSYTWSRQQNYEVSFYRGFIVQIPTTRRPSPFNLKAILLMDDLSASEKEKEKWRQREIKKIDSRYKNAAAQGKPLSPRDGLAEFGGTWGYDLLTILKCSRFSNLRRETIDKQEMYAVDFLPALPGANSNSTLVQDTSGGSLWIDTQNLVVTKALIRKATPFKKNALQTVYEYGYLTELRQRQICDGFWAPTYRYDSASETTLRFSDYRLAGGEPACDENNKSKLK